MLKVIMYFFIYCSFFISQSACSKHKITIHNLSKNCESILEENIIDYKLCESWMLNKNAVINIIQQKQVADILNPVRDIAPSDMRVYYSGKATIDNLSYDFTIYSTSWFSLYNNKKDQVKYYFCQKKKCSNYFIGNYISEGVLSKVEHENLYEFEEKLLKKINDNKSKIIVVLEDYKPDDKWAKVYIASDYELTINKNGCDMKSLIDSTITKCYAYAKDKLYIYSPLKTENGYTEFSYKDNTRFNDGDFILKLF